jgi:hypothetical protein
MLLITLNIFTDRIDMVRIEANKLRKELTLTESQAEEIYKILKEIDKQKKDSFEKIQILSTEEKIKHKLDLNTNILNKIKLVLEDAQYIRYLKIKKLKINNKLSLAIINKIKPDDYLTIKIDIVISTYYEKLDYLKKKFEKDKNKNNEEELNEVVMMLDKAVFHLLNEEQKDKYKRCTTEFHDLVKTYVVGEEKEFKGSNDFENEIKFKM